MASPFQSYLTLSKWIFVEEKVAVVGHSKMKREREKERERPKERKNRFVDKYELIFAKAAFVNMSQNVSNL